MKKILIIQDSMGGGGAERVLVTMLQKLNPEKFDITLLLIYGEGPFMDSIPEYVKVKSLFKSYKSKATRLVTHFYDLRNFVREKRARRVLEGEHFDLTVSFMEGGTAKLHSQLLDLAPRNYSWVHSNLRMNRWYDFWFKKDEETKFYNSVDKIAFVSIELKNEFEKLFKTKADKTVIYNPINRVFLSEKAQEERPAKSELFTIVNSARLVEFKNHNKLIDTAAVLRNRGRKFRIDILGDGPLRNELAQKIHSLQLDDYVFLNGFIKNPFPKIKNADIFCLSSNTEGFPMVVLESLSVGTPIVSTPIPCVKEALVEGGGIITDGTPEGIATAIESLMDNPSHLQELKEEALRSAARVDLPAIMPQVEDFLLH